MRLKLPKANPKQAKKLVKNLLVLAFIVAIPVIAYYSSQELFYSNRVKVTVLERQTDKPLRGKHIVLQTICEQQPCTPKILAEGKTNTRGHFGITTKQMTGSFEVVAEGYKTDGPWRKRPGSLFFSRQYDERDFYSVNLGQTDLTIKLTPAGQ